MRREEAGRRMMSGLSNGLWFFAGSVLSAVALLYGRDGTTINLWPWTVITFAGTFAASWKFYATKPVRPATSHNGGI